MNGHDHLDIIWLSELNMAVIYCQDRVPEEFVAAAIILKGEDGTDLFIPYEGYVEGAPIGFSIGRGQAYSVSVLGFGPATDTVELAFWNLNDTLFSHLDGPLKSEAGGASLLTDAEEGREGKNNQRSGADGVDMSLIGFGERNQVWQGKISSEIGYNSIDYSVEGRVDYSELLSTYLVDTRQVENETFTAFFVSAIPRREITSEEMEVGPALHLRPLHHYDLALKAQTLSVSVDEVDHFSQQGIYREEYDDYEEEDSSLNKSAIINRHGGLLYRDVPEFILNMGTASEQLDFVLGHGFKIFWRRQFENWHPAHEEGNFSPKASAAFSNQLSDDRQGAAEGLGPDDSFSMQRFSIGNELLQQGDHRFFCWDIKDAIIGDIVGLCFNSEDASIKLDVTLEEGPQTLAYSDQSVLFIFMGDSFVPLTKEILMLPENLGVTARLQGHIDKGLQQNKSASNLKSERAKCATFLFERDETLQTVFNIETLQEIAAQGPFGPELMVYRDHILRVVQSADMAPWMSEIEKSRFNSRKGRLVDTLQFETFCKAPQLAHALVFNESFRAKFHSKPLDPHSLRMPVLEYLMSKLFDDQVIDWAMRLKGESQAILWQLVLKRPEMVERLYELKLEPDIALNPFDDQVLSHVETALHDSSHISAELIEKRVIPIYTALGDEDKVSDLAQFARALNFGAEGKALSLGELSVCLAAVETANQQWARWYEDVVEIFQPLVAPLTIEVPAFHEGGDFSAIENLNEFRNETGHLIERLVKELGCSAELQGRALEFLMEVESRILLEEIGSKLDLALKYHRDLSVGVQHIYDHFDVSPAQLLHLNEIDSREWPNIENFSPQFQEPLLKQLKAQQSEFERLVKLFAQGAQPDDELFHQTLIDALAEFSNSLPLLLWLETGKSLEERVENVQKRLKTALLKVHPNSAKLRRSKSLAEAVRQLVEAERMGAMGWPMVSQSLDVIEKDLPAGMG